MLREHVPSLLGPIVTGVQVVALGQGDGGRTDEVGLECSTVCPKNVDPAGAIQRYKVKATTDWFKSLLMPWGKR